MYLGACAYHRPRSYTRAFGKRLFEAYQAGRLESRCDLRTRPKLSAGKSDRELFNELPLGDVWIESECHLAFEYLWSSKHLRSGSGCSCLFRNVACVRDPRETMFICLVSQDSGWMDAYHGSFQERTTWRGWEFECNTFQLIIYENPFGDPFLFHRGFPLQVAKLEAHPDSHGCV